MEKNNEITYIEDFEKFRTNNIFSIPNILFIQYLNIIYPNLVLRENDTPEVNDHHPKSDILAYNSINNKALIDRSISVNSFNQYLGIQNLISERIFKYIDKSKKGKLSKTDFCNGLFQIFFGNISELSKLTFFISDFNEDGKIYKSDMKLILSYIPTNSNQQEYIKKINKIIDEFFEEAKNEEELQLDLNINNEEEITYDFYLSKITEAMNDKSVNGAFFIFINLLKYIFINKPFYKENIFPVNNLKNKHLLKVSVPKMPSIKNVNIFQKKSLVKSVVFSGNTNFNNNTNNENTLFNISRRGEKKYTDYKQFEKNKAIAKIQQKDLFSIKKSASVTVIDKKMKQKYDNKKHDFITAKDKQPNNLKNDVSVKQIINDLESKNKIHNRNSSLGRLNSGKNLSYNTNKSIRISNKINNIVLQNKFHKNSVKEMKKLVNNTKIENKNSILPVISSYTPLKNNLNNNNNLPKQKVGFKISPILKLKKKNENEPKISNFLEEIDNTNNINSEKEYGFYLYKFSEEEYHSSLKKYYAVLREKEILFYSSNLKDELCTIWNLNDAIVCILRKATINKYLYYPIKIIYKNNLVSYLLFEIKDSQVEFGNQLKINIDNINFENEYETKEKIGEGHFAEVKKCLEKKSGKEYAVKIITKTNLKKKDLDLIIQEKNYMKLIKHPNVVSLIKDFEDEKYIYLVMEYYKGGDLFSYMYENRKKQKNFGEKTIAKIIKIIAQTIQYLNYFGIVHRDLKPENIVFGIKDDISSLTLIDLGVAITLPYGKTSSEPVGTLDYISPEIFSRKPYSHKVDVWSLGIILYILFTMGKIYPFDSDSKDKEEREKIIGKKIVFLQQEYPPEFFGNKSKYLISLIDKSLEKSPDKRISIDEFLNNYWLINNCK